MAVKIITRPRVSIRALEAAIPREGQLLFTYGEPLFGLDKVRDFIPGIWTTWDTNWGMVEVPGDEPLMVRNQASQVQGRILHVTQGDLRFLSQMHKVRYNLRERVDVLVYSSGKWSNGDQAVWCHCFINGPAMHNGLLGFVPWQPGKTLRWENNRV